MKWSFIFILSFMSLVIFAQDKGGHRLFQAGFVAGFNAAQLDGDRFRGYSKLGTHIGLKVKYPLPSQPHISLSTEMLFSMRGSSQDIDFASSNNNQVKINLNYIEMPILLYYKEWKLDFHGGLSYGRLISASTSILTTGYLEEDFSKHDLGLLLGVSYLIDSHFAAIFRFNRSFTNAVKKSANKDPLVNHLVTFRIDYLF